jgi:hypothetical protein
VSIEAEVIFNLGPYEHFKLTVRGDSTYDVMAQLETSEEFARWMGDYHASTKAAVLYGRDKAFEAVAKAEPPVRDEPFASTQEYMEASFREPPEEAQEDPVKLLTEELGATVLEVTEKPVEGPEEASTGRPWKNKPTAKKKPKAWEDPVTEGPDATPEESVTATKAARKAASAGDWDW